LKAVPLTLALAALSMFAASCSSHTSAQVRFVQAIQDSSALDVDVSGPNVTSTQEFTDVQFLGIQPSQPGHTNIPTGSNTITGFSTGTTTEVFNSTVSWEGGQAYTVVGTGFSTPNAACGTGTSGAMQSCVAILSVPDTIPTPPAGDVEFRVIHASPSGPSMVDVYIELNPNSGPGLPIAIKGLLYTQASNYVSYAYNPNNVANPPGFTVYVTPSGSTTPIISETINPGAAGAARTLVLTDMQNGTMMNSTFLELSDLN
jgi:hypothetical protein